MKAIHWIRSRQEERELAYWLSLVSFDHHDRSINNRIYLLYLVLFFSVWIFVTLTFFASGGSVILRLLNPDNPISAAVAIEIVIVGIWNTISLRQSLKRSPVVFSEQDATLICQMPVNPRRVILRWIFMPWVKSVVPLSLLASLLGFSLAEIVFPGAGVNRLPEYAWYGFRALLAVIPIHSGLFVLQWLAGILVMQKSHDRHYLTWFFVSISIFIILFSFNLAQNLVQAVQFSWNNPAILLLYPFLSGFGQGNTWVALSISIFMAGILLGILYLASGKFNLGQAAEETSSFHTMSSARQYGFNALSQQLRKKQKLGMTRSPSRLPALEGEKALIWKDLLQSQRSFELLSLSNWVAILGLMISIAILPDLSSRAFLFTIWVITVGKVSVLRLRSDLSCWAFVRQIPFSHKEFLKYDLLSSFVLAGFLSIVGLFIGSVISGNPFEILAFMIPGIIASVAGMSAADVIRRSRGDLLIDGLVADIGAGGIISGLLLAGLPYTIYALLQGLFWFSFALLLSILFGVGAFFIATKTYQKIGNA